MAKGYRAPKLFNALAALFARLGIGGRVEELTTTGRRSGLARSNPVAPITVDGVEYLVSPYGQVDWVHNLRDDPIAELRSGRHTRRVRLVEETGEHPEVVQAYHAREPYSRRYMDLPANPESSDVTAKGADFPVFRIYPA